MAIYAEIASEEATENDLHVLDGSRDFDKGGSPVEYLLQQRALFITNIHLADQKSGYVAILHGVLITGISSVMQNNDIFFRLSKTADKWFYSCAILALFYSFAANMLAFIPRAKRSAARDNSWVDIADGNVDVIVKELIMESPLDRMRRITVQIQALAAICNHKFKFIKHSIISLGIATTSAIILYLRLVLS
jgi:hypothetical protein